MYSLTKQDLKHCQDKLDKQREFLSSCKIQTANGQIRSYLDFSHSANLSSRYYTELINKVNSIYSVLKSETQTDWQPIFITVTLDGFFRDFLYADFSRYNEELHQDFIPNNERFGYLKNKIKNKEAFTIKDLYNVLSFQLHRFQKSSNYMKIKRKFGIHYLRVTEPHKNGVPHFHIMLYCPVQYVDILRDTYKQYFPAKQNIRKLSKNSNDLLGFQTDIKNAPAYVLKYLFKSFLDVKNKTDLDYLQAWYINFRIPRVITSHTLIPAWVYRKMIPLEKDWYYLTHIKNTGLVEWSEDNNYIRFEDVENERVLEYDNGIYKKYSLNRLIVSFGTKKEIKPLSPQTFKLNYQKPKQSIKYFIDGEEYISRQNQLVKLQPTITVSRMKDLRLYKYFQHIDNKIDTINLQHYGLVKNECIKRGLLSGEQISLNQYNTDFNIRF